MQNPLETDTRTKLYNDNNEFNETIELRCA